MMETTVEDLSPLATTTTTEVLSEALDANSTVSQPPSPAVVPPVTTEVPTTTVSEAAAISPKSEESKKEDPVVATPVVVVPPAPAPVAVAVQKNAMGLPAGAKQNALIEEANEEIGKLLLAGSKVTQKEVSALQAVLKENVALKEKVTKLKSLLGRSAKAQREAKLEGDAAKAKLVDSNQQIIALQTRVESLASRPTHMDLLADFETNFDRALLTVDHKQQQHQQQSGEDPSSSSSAIRRSLDAPSGDSSEDGGDREATGVVSAMLLNELEESKSRMERLEQLNSALLRRASQLEATNGSLKQQQDTTAEKNNSLKLELRMARMETEQACREAKEKEALVKEMQMEIDLVTKSSVDANARAAEGRQVAKTFETDRKHLSVLQQQVQALQEWALASAESKRLAVERAQRLERKLRDLQDDNDHHLNDNNNNNSSANSSHAARATTNGGAHGAKAGTTTMTPEGIMERRLWTKTGSLVIGAGHQGHVVMELGDGHKIETNEVALLRWRFDLTPTDMDILFSILKGNCPDSVRQSKADAIIKNRHVTGGGGGDLTGAFAVQGACTLLWTNSTSWVRPRTVKFHVEAYAVLE